MLFLLVDTAATHARLAAAFVVLLAAGGCGSPAPASVPPSAGDASASAAPPAMENLVITGRIVTMDQPPVAEAMLIEDGIVTAIGTRAEVLAAAGTDVPVIDTGDGVAYPGFIDAHAHWIGDRDYYAMADAAGAMDAALRRGWTSISEQWVNEERLDELTSLAGHDALPIRVDAYLALNFDKDFYGDWYEPREPGSVGDDLRVRGLKIHVDDGSGTVVNWDAADLTATVGRADAAGWQVSAHVMSTTAMERILDAFEAAIGPSGPNPLHHRVEHAMQVTDEQLARLAAMDIGAVIQLDGAPDWILDEHVIAPFDRDDPGDVASDLARWRDLVDAGLHVGSSTDAPWTFPDFKLTDDLGRPVDQIAAGMDGRVRLHPTTPPWLTDQPLTAEQGLRAVTLDAAWAIGDEARRGHLARGTLGDITILSGDVTSAMPAELRAMTVVATIVGGVPVHCSDATTCATPGP